MAITTQFQPTPQLSVYSSSERQRLQQYAHDTWQSMAALTYPNGLSADSITIDGVLAAYTSPTNIGAYLWSVLAAYNLQMISSAEAQQRIQQTLGTLTMMQRHAASGMYFNWYCPRTGEVLKHWPANGSKIVPFLSSVDNGWLAVALIVVSNGLPALRDQAQAILNQMDFGFFLNQESGLLYGGCWPSKANNRGYAGYTRYDFGTLNAETRITSYIGIAMGQLPPEHYFRLWRTCPVGSSWNRRKLEPEGIHRPYLGVDVFEGHFNYDGMHLVPSWGGSMFEALMAPLFVPEAQWGPHSWGINHPLYVQAHISHGLTEARYGYWGFSPARNPSGGYSVYGVDAIGMNPDGYPSNNDNTLADYKRNPGPLPMLPPEAYANGVVTPHAVFLALPYAPEAAMHNLNRLCQDFDLYGKWGFWDSVNVQTGQVSHYALALDQGMVMAALSNALSENWMQQVFSQGMIEREIRPLLAMEEFTAGSTPERFFTFSVEAARNQPPHFY